jgi:hypothetical protein
MWISHDFNENRGVITLLPRARSDRPTISEVGAKNEVALLCVHFSHFECWKNAMSGNQVILPVTRGGTQLLG